MLSISGFVGFRGSFLELLFQLESFGSGLDRQPLLIHMPGFNEESIRKTPLLELYEIGMRFRKSLDTLIREAATARVTPAEIEQFLAKQPSLDEADAWLTTSVSESTFGLAAALAEIGSTLLVEGLTQINSGPALRVTAPAEVKILKDYLHKLTGMDDAWIDTLPSAKDGPLAPLLEALKAWILWVEYVHDLKREPHQAELRRLGGLSPLLVKACCDLVERVRRCDNGDAYERMADEVAGLFPNELQAMAPDDLGQIDTFREEEHRVLDGAVEALHQRDWAKAKTWWEARQGETSFWLQRDPLRRWAWTLVQLRIEGDGVTHESVRAVNRQDGRAEILGHTGRPARRAGQAAGVCGGGDRAVFVGCGGGGGVVGGGMVSSNAAAGTVAAER